MSVAWNCEERRRQSLDRIRCAECTDATLTAKGQRYHSRVWHGLAWGGVGAAAFWLTVWALVLLFMSTRPATEPSQGAPKPSPVVVEHTGVVVEWDDGSPRQEWGTVPARCAATADCS